MPDPVSVQGLGVGIPEPRPRMLRALDVGRMVREPAPSVPWLVDGILARGHLTMLAGREGLGKSMVSVALTIAVAAGSSVVGYRAEPGRVLYVDGENAESEIHRRIHGLGVRADAVDNLQIDEALHGFDLRDDLGELDERIRGVRADLVVLDSFRRLWGGKENKSEEAGPVVDSVRDLARRTGAAILLLHHTGKGDDAEYRGTTAIGGGTDLNFEMRRHVGEDKTLREIRCPKCRIAPEPDPKWFRIVTELGMTLIEECERPDDAGRPTPKQDELAPRVLGVFNGSPLTLTDVAGKVGRKASDGTLRRVLDRLVDRGDLERDTGMFRLSHGNVAIPGVCSDSVVANADGNCGNGGSDG